MTPPRTSAGRTASALAAVAERWADPDHPSRQQAVEAALGPDYRFTEEGVAFALNHAAEVLASGRLEAWVGGTDAGGARVALALPAGAPFEGGLVVGALLMAGAAPVVTDPSPLVEAFFRETAEAGAAGVVWRSRGDLFSGVDAALGTGPEPTVQTWTEGAGAEGIPPERRLFRVALPGAAVLDGNEDAAALSGLAEDLLLHDAAAPAGVRLVWAPDDLDPDALLGHLAGFREVFPAHPSTDGTLAMPAAFLAAAKQPHASGPGFLLSKGAPEPQSGAHLRWVGYRTLADVVEWAGEGAGYLVARPALAEGLRQAGLPAGVPVLAPGDVHRPEPGRFPLDDALLRWLGGLG